MKRIVFALALACFSSLAWAGDKSPLIINEIRIDHGGTDTDEYFELRGPPGASLDGLTYVVIGDGTAALGSGVIETVISLDGLSIGASGFFLAADDKFGALLTGTPDLTIVAADIFENSDNVTHLLVENFTGSLGADLDTDDDGVLDVTAWAIEHDRIALVEEENPPTATEFHYGPPSIGPEVTPTGSFVPGHVYRCEPDGTWTIGPFDPAVGVDTPGAPNAGCPTPPVGACCLAEGVCKELSEEDCLASKGVYIGDGTFCEPGVCGEPSGACCIPFGGGCAVMTAIECSGAKGLYQGDGTVCEPDPCIVTPTGACCVPEIPCTILTESECLAIKGTYQGDGSVCKDDTCAPACNPICPADINGDGVVDGIDLGILLAHWGDCLGRVPCCSDLSGAGHVDGISLGILLANWSIPAGSPGCGG